MSVLARSGSSVHEAGVVSSQVDIIPPRAVPENVDAINEVTHA